MTAPDTQPESVSRSSSPECCRATALHTSGGPALPARVSLGVSEQRSPDPSNNHHDNEDQDRAAYA